jgi:hypothetical protein
MSWAKLIVYLDIEPRSICCSDGKTIATVTVRGETDGDDEENTYEAFLKEDYVLPDMLWRSGEVSVAANSKIEKTYSVELRCDKHRKVIGPHGSSHERRAEVYAYVLSGDLEWQSNEIAVECSKED